MNQHPDELRELVRTGFDELGKAVGGIGGVHQGIADRVFGFVGAPVVRMSHEAITRGVYAALRGGATAAGAGAGVAVGLRQAAERELSSTRRGAMALAALNGLAGDELERKGSALQEPMTVRVDSRAVELRRDALAGAFPDARERIVVFVHGLMGTEHWWGYGERIEADLGVTAVHVRYNTGRHISENGASLSALMEELCAEWPEPVREIALVGHSMGGLVARSACCFGERAGAGWIPRVRHVVSLGTPHLGAPMAQGVYYLAHGLDRLPETRPFANFFKRRSAGIRDLRGGSLVDEDWRDRDPDALRAAALAEVPLLKGVHHHFVSATITRDDRHPLGRLIGDWLVLKPSATGRSRARTIGFRDEDGRHLGGTHHIALLNHPLVYEQLRDWLSVSEEPDVPALPAMG